MGIRRGRKPGPDFVLNLLLGGLLLWMSLALVSDRSPIERQHLMRIWSLFGAGFIAVAIPHLLFPQKNFRLYLLAPPVRRVLLFDALRRGSQVLLLVAVPAVVTAGAGGAVLSAIAAVLLLAGVWLLAIGRYVRLGAASQGWQEGTRGGWYRSSLDYMSVPPALPDGSMPMIFATTALFIVAIAGVLFWSAMAGFSALILVPAGIILLMGLIDTSRLRRRVDAELFHTQSFFDEIFRMYGGMREADREAVPYESIYWAPNRIRPAIWAHLVQMDRRAPLGRVIAAGHLFLFILVWNQGYSAAVIGYLLMFSLAKNMAPALIAGEDTSPPVFNRFIQPVSNWIWTRVFVSLRWTLPWVISLAIVAIFAASFPTIHIIVWTGVDVALAIAAAVLVTYLNEFRHKRALA